MQLTSLLAFAVGSLAANVLHEKRDYIPNGWEKGERIQSHALVPMRIALTQQNIDQIENHLLDVSARLWTFEIIANSYRYLTLLAQITVSIGVPKRSLRLLLLAKRLV